jgi:hypothetical protein
MKRGKDVRYATGRPENPNAAKEVMAVMFVLVEQTPGAFTLRLVLNDEVINAVRSQGALQSFLEEADELYANFRTQFEAPQNPSRTHKQ